MDEKTLAQAKVNGLLGILLIIIGVFIALTCPVWEGELGDWPMIVAVIGGIILIAWGVLIIISKGELYVTNKRVYLINRFGNRFEIPIDSISSVGVNGQFILFASNSAKMKVNVGGDIENIYDAISGLLVERQK